MRKRRILPTNCASSSWSFSSFTRNSRFGGASVTSPSISSFCSTAIDAFRRRSAGVRKRNSRGLLHSTPHRDVPARFTSHAQRTPPQPGRPALRRTRRRPSELALHRRASAPCTRRGAARSGVQCHPRQLDEVAEARARRSIFRSTVGAVREGSVGTPAHHPVRQHRHLRRAGAGTQSAARAVGRASSRNRISIIVPCHRVVGATATCNYAGYPDQAGAPRAKACSPGGYRGRPASCPNGAWRLEGARRNAGNLPAARRAPPATAEDSEGTGSSYRSSFHH